MPTYEQNKAHIKNYLAEQDEIRVRMSKKSGLKDAVQRHIQSTGDKSMNEFVIRAIVETMRRDQHPSSLMDDGTPPAITAYLSSKKAGDCPGKVVIK